ncbi:MAG TPA: 7-cyano-7-deazaguanine synthase [Candidatus Binatia bacterium]|jgi:7-cyano-7-deazaguanine synthase|nr:7-cyano-7-deazaguanine synthase [Candidatus Binatia bacterium]
MSLGLLLSGGMDSVALAYWKRPAFAYTVDYGQLAADGEIRAAAAVCEQLAITHRVLRADCRKLGTGDLVGTAPSPLAPVPEWWPFRNQLIITLAGAKAITDKVTELMIGTIRTDGQHADGRVDFIKEISKLMSLQEGGIRVAAPAIDVSAVELMRISSVPLAILAWSHSCHVSALACGVCRGCTKHAATMTELGYGDY